VARKLVVVVLGLLVIAMALLAIRQREVEIAREVARAHWRLIEQRRAIASWHKELAEVTHPDRIREGIGAVQEAAAQEASSPWGG